MHTNFNYLINTLNRLLEVAGSMATRKQSVMRYKLMEVEGSVVEVKIENWNNTYFEVNLDNPIEVVRLYRSSLKQWREYCNHCRLHDEARKSNCLVVGDQLVIVVGETLGSWDCRQQPTYRVVQADGTYSCWIGPSAEYALNEALRYISSTPVSVEREGEAAYA